MQADYKNFVRCDDGKNEYWIPRKVLQKALFDYEMIDERAYVRYATGSKMYDMSEKCFRELAAAAGAVRKIGHRLTLVKLADINRYLDCFD